jgi:hypothetical protein
MVHIFLPDKIALNKDCVDWVPLNDGTNTGDSKYCNLSLQCRQLNMKSDWYEFNDPLFGNTFDYFCTGMYANKNDNQDEEVC